MRPRQICRGMLGRGARGGPAGVRFNEAPANLPGNAYYAARVVANEIVLQ